MTKDTEITLKLEGSLLVAETGSLKKPYVPPRLQDWGSLSELTAGDQVNFTDADFNGGSQAV
jgi:hypothetical protein